MGKLRELRKNVLEALKLEPWPSGLALLEEHSPKTLLGPLYACLLEPDQLVRWRTASAFGVVVARLFQNRPDDARQLVRQFMWRLNEESGNVAWGIPEAFGEILVQEPHLAREFHRVLASYIHERDCKTGDNYLELCPLRRGVYWGLGCLAEARPELALPALDDLILTLAGDDPESRGLAAWAVGSLLPLSGDRRAAALAALEALRQDGAVFDFYTRGSLSQVSVSELARKALENAS